MKGVQGRFYPSMKGALSLCLWASTSHTQFLVCLSSVSVTLHLFVCVGLSQLLPTSVSVRLSVPPPHPHPFVCHQDSTLVTTGAKAGQQVCEGVGEGGVRLCGTSPPHLHLTLIFFGIPLPFPRRATTLNSRGSSPLWASQCLCLPVSWGLTLGLSFASLHTSVSLNSSLRLSVCRFFSLRFSGCLCTLASLSVCLWVSCPQVSLCLSVTQFLSSSSLNIYLYDCLE